MAEDFDVWFDAVLRQVNRPAWLKGDAPYSEVAISSRARLMRNLEGFFFPHRCSRQELEEVRRLVKDAVAPPRRQPLEGRARKSDISTQFEERQRISDAERAMLVGSRLISPEFPWQSPGRSVYLSGDRASAIMVNEEDHLRIQAVVPGLSPGLALSTAESVEKVLTGVMQFAYDAEFGYLSASASNLGSGKRVGAMLHLIGLAECGELAGGQDIV